MLVREQDDAVELALLLPRRLLEDGGGSPDPDTLLQAVEGVSHFVYVAERVRMELPTTLLELELQAEVDKFVLLAIAGDQLESAARDRLCRRLFEQVQFLHAEGSEHGERYRLANALAFRYVRRLDRRAPAPTLRAELCRFYRSGQTEKIRLARAA